MLRHLTAIGYAYFETLNRAADMVRIEGEIDRLKAFNSSVIEEYDGYKHTYIDFADEFTDLLKELADSSFASDGEAKLISAFNDTYRGQSIIQYLRVSSLNLSLT